MNLKKRITNELSNTDGILDYEVLKIDLHNMTATIRDLFIWDFEAGIGDYFIHIIELTPAKLHIIGPTVSRKMIYIANN